MEASPATELFGFGDHGSPAFMPKGVDLRNISTGSGKLVMSAIDNLDHAISDWEHQLSKELNNAIGGLFGANKDRIKLLSADLKKYQSLAADANKRLKTPGLTEQVRADLMQQEQTALDHMEQTRARINDLNANILIPNEIMQAVNESTALAKEGLNLVVTEYASYERTIESKTKVADLRFGIIKDDAYINEMNRHRMNLTDPYSDILQRLNTITKQASQINDTRITGAKVTTPVENAVKFDLVRVRALTTIYEKYKKITSDIHQRLNVLRAEMRLIMSGKPTKYKLTSVMIAQEVVFLTTFCLKFSDMLLLYMSPIMGVIESAGNVAY
jgi:hypothetical protein